MAYKTGILRLAAVIRWLSVIWIAVGLILTVVLAQGSSRVGESVALGAIFSLVPGALGLAVAYIVAGFGAEER